MTKRTDIHRPSAIIPAEYAYVTSYHLATQVDGWPMPPYNIDFVIELRSSNTFAHTGGLGQCSICGARFVYGDVWKHEPTNEHIHIGWECAEKYEMLADRSSFELEMGRRKVAAARECQRDMNARRRARFLAEHEGLEAALAVEHPTITDIASRFRTYCELSDKQVALVMKIANEKNAPKPVETHVPAPIGRHTFRGVVVSAKTHESAYGVEYKMTVKVTADGGTWLAWSTIPSSMLETSRYSDGGELTRLRGAEVEVTATLSAGKDPHFAFAKRPIGKVLRSAVESN